MMVCVHMNAELDSVVWVPRADQGLVMLQREILKSVILKSVFNIDLEERQRHFGDIVEENFWWHGFRISTHLTYQKPCY